MPAEIRALLAAYAADAGPGRTEIGRRLLVLLRTAPEPERHRVLDTLRAGGPGHGRAEDNPTEAGRMDDAATMDAGQVVDLVRRGFEIGAHGVTHAALSTLGPARLREEIRGCRDDLRALGIEPASFAYPYGDAGARDDVVVRAVAEAGFRIAVTTEERAVPRGSEALRLPRKVISPQTLGQVATKLERMAWGA
jgi:peptidoglycan/xylan/chitin deacetylase (PgdA/CDA1 family)